MYDLFQWFGDVVTFQPTFACREIESLRKYDFPMKWIMMIRFEKHTLIALLCTQNEILTISNLTGSSQHYMGLLGLADVRDNQFIYIFVQNYRNEITFELIIAGFFHVYLSRIDLFSKSFIFSLITFYCSLLWPMKFYWWRWLWLCNVQIKVTFSCENELSKLKVL